MKKAFKTAVMTIGALLMAAGNAWANIVIYEKVDLFETQEFFSDSFFLCCGGVESGPYRATLTDFDFPEAMVSTGMAVTTATELLGRLDAPGSFTFDAMVDELYHVSFFGKADPSASFGLYGIEISQVPLPAAVWLFASGVLGLAAMGRRREVQA